ncbi:MAG: WD40/YVTN/BNR-like repeat-containing protein, partial [Acidimicrobiia bacterium]
AFSLDDPATPLIADTRINHISRDGGSWWAVDGKTRVHRDGAVVATGPDGVALNCVQPAPGTTWVGATAARLFRLEGDGLVEDETFAEAPGRDGWYTPWGGLPDVRSMAADAAGALFVNVHVGGILRYDQNGLTPTLDQDSDVHQVIAHPTRPGTVLAACARGMAFSTNGHDFEYRDDGLHATYCRAVAITGDTVLLSVSTGPRSTRARLYRAGQTAGPFRECREGLPEWFDDNLDTHCLAVVDGSVFAGHGGTVWRSDDDGETWIEVATGLPKVTCLA